jgi:hypothetical protein
MGYRYPSAYRHDTRDLLRPRGMPIVVSYPKARPVGPRQPWAIALERNVRFGWAAARAGAVAGLFTAMYSVPALTLLTNRSPIAPIFAAAAPILGTRALDVSLKNALHLDAGALLVGLAVNAVLGAAYAVLFAAIIRNEPIVAGRLLPRGVLFGLAVLAITNALLPALARIEGWTVMIFAHLLFGFLLACWPLARPGDFQRRPQLKVVSRR